MQLITNPDKKDQDGKTNVFNTNSLLEKKYISECCQLRQRMTIVTKLPSEAEKKKEAEANAGNPLVQVCMVAMSRTRRDEHI